MRFFFAGVILGFWFVFTPLAIAQREGIGISVEPFLSDLTFEEGDKEQPFRVMLSNTTEREMRLDAFPVDFGSLDLSAGVAFLGAAQDIETAYEKADWIVLESATITLPPNSEKTLSGKLVNTDRLSPGGHYGAILFSVKGTDALAIGPASVAVDQRISVLVFLKKRGGEQYGMEFKSFGYKRDVLGNVRSAEFVFKNTGNTHIAPRGLVELFDPRHRLVAKGIVNETSSLILPSTERSFPIVLAPVETAWIPGKYLLRSSYRYDGKEKYETREVSFVIVPSRFLLALIGGMLLGVGWLAIRRKWLKKKEKQI